MTETAAHILVVEDEAPLAELIRYNLAAQGLRATVAGTGEEAEVLVAEDHFDLIVLDWMLPGLSGLELCRRLRKREATQAIPVLMLVNAWSPATRRGVLEPRALFPFAPHWLLPQQNATSALVTPQV